MKKLLHITGLILLMLLVCACSTAGAGKSYHWTDGVSVAQLKKDIEESEKIQKIVKSEYVEDTPFHYVSHEVIARRTVPDDRTDFINATVIVRNGYFEVSMNCFFEYYYSTEGWLLGSLHSSDKKVTPIAAPNGQIIARETIENPEYWDDRVNQVKHPYFVYNGTLGVFRYRELFDCLEVTECVLESDPMRARLYFKVDSPMVDFEGYYPLEFSEKQLRWRFAPTTIDDRDYDDTMHITAYHVDCELLEGAYRTVYGDGKVKIKNINPQAWNITYTYTWTRRGLIEDTVCSIEETSFFNPISLQFSMKYYDYAMCYSYEDDCWYNISNWDGGVMKNGGMRRSN